jgi:hypothetical protein
MSPLFVLTSHIPEIAEQAGISFGILMSGMQPFSQPAVTPKSISGTRAGGALGVVSRLKFGG